MYRKEIETKVIRTIHVIDFWEGTTRAIDLMKSLAHVPDKARIKCLVNLDTNVGEHEIWFESESVDE